MSNVVSVGVDLADVKRVREALARFPERFYTRVLTDAEAAYCRTKRDPAPHVAARFAAKEAVIKCLGGGCDLRDIEVTRALSGAPSIHLSGRAAERAAGRTVLISLSHLPDIACAFATLVESSPQSLKELLLSDEGRAELPIPPRDSTGRRQTNPQD